MPQFISQERLGEMLATTQDREMQRSMVRRMVDKGFEVEGLNAEFSPFRTFVNAPGSAVQFATDIWQAVRHPIQTGEGLGKVLAGGLRKVIPENLKNQGGVGTENEEAFDAVMDFFVQRYGSKDKILNTIEKDPVGFISDAASVVTGIGGAVKGAGVAVGKGATKAATTAIRLRQTPRVIRAAAKTEEALLKTGRGLKKAGDAVARAGRILEPTTALKKTSRAFNKTVGINKIADHMAERLSKGTLGFTDLREGNLSVTRKESIVNFLNRYGVHGSIPEMIDQLSEIGTKSSRALDAEFGRVNQLYKDRNALKLLREMQKSFKNQTNLSDKHTDMVQKIDILGNKALLDGLNLTELNQVKRMTSDVLRIFKQSGEAGTGLKVDNLNELRKGLRKSIEKRAADHDIPNVKELNQQIQAANTLRSQFQRIEKVSKKRKPFISSLLSAGVIGGAAYTGHPLFIGGAGTFVGAQMLLRSPRFRSWAATKLQLLSEGEFRSLENGVRLGKWDTVGKRVAREFRKDFKLVAPELRLGGLIAQKEQEAGG